MVLSASFPKEFVTTRALMEAMIAPPMILPRTPFRKLWLDSSNNAAILRSTTGVSILKDTSLGRGGLQIVKNRDKKLITRRKIQHTDAAEVARLHAGGRADAGARNRGQHRDLQRHQRDPAEAAAVRGVGSAGVPHRVIGAN